MILRQDSYAPRSGYGLTLTNYVKGCVKYTGKKCISRNGIPLLCDTFLTATLEQQKHIQSYSKVDPLGFHLCYLNEHFIFLAGEHQQSGGDCLRRQHQDAEVPLPSPHTVHPAS